MMKNKIMSFNLDQAWAERLKQHEEGYEIYLQAINTKSEGYRLYAEGRKLTIEAVDIWKRGDNLCLQAIELNKQAGIALNKRDKDWKDALISAKEKVDTWRSSKHCVLESGKEYRDV